jgi:hypothetical protein
MLAQENFRLSATRSLPWETDTRSWSRNSGIEGPQNTLLYSKMPDR